MPAISSDCGAPTRTIRFIVSQCGRRLAALRPMQPVLLRHGLPAQPRSAGRRSSRPPCPPRCPAIPWPPNGSGPNTNRPAQHHVDHVHHDHREERRAGVARSAQRRVHREHRAAERARRSPAPAGKPPPAAAAVGLSPIQSISNGDAGLQQHQRAESRRHAQPQPLAEPAVGQRSSRARPVARETSAITPVATAPCRMLKNHPT